MKNVSIRNVKLKIEELVDEIDCYLAELEIEGKDKEYTCGGTTCCKCILNDLPHLCSIALNHREVQIDVIVERLKREIEEYERSRE